VRLLALDPTRSSIPVLDGLVVLKEPAQLQAAAVAALWRTGDARVPGMLVAKWRTSPAPVREAALAGFFASPARLGELLDAIQAGRIDPPTLGRARIAELTRSRDARVRARAEVLFARALPADRKSVIDRYRPALTRAGDAAPGRAVFRTHCAGCHRIGDLGVAVGPDLVNLAMRRSRGVLMADILDPNQSIAAGFEEYRIETTDGRTLTGVMASDSATAVVLRRKEGAEDTVLRASIASLRLSTVSAMPEGLEEDLSVADLSDLLAYLKGVGQPASPPPGSR
jgi:putative heme-binding domain-containing protein